MFQKKLLIFLLFVSCVGVESEVLNTTSTSKEISNTPTSTVFKKKLTSYGNSELEEKIDCSVYVNLIGEFLKQKYVTKELKPGKDSLEFGNFYADELNHLMYATDELNMKPSDVYTYLGDPENVDFEKLANVFFNTAELMMEDEQYIQLCNYYQYARQNDLTLDSNE